MQKPSCSVYKQIKILYVALYNEKPYNCICKQYCLICEKGCWFLGDVFSWDMPTPLWSHDTSNKFCIPYAKFLLYYMEDILHTLRNISPIIYGRHFAQGAQNFSYNIWETFCIPYAKFLLQYRGMLFGIGVRYFSTSIPLYIQEIFCVGVRKITPIYMWVQI